MQIRVVEEIALDAPYFVVHLVPFLARIYVSLHAVQFQRAVPLLWCGRGSRNKPSLALPIENLLAIRRNCEGSNSAEKWLGLPRCEIKLRNGRRVGLSEARHVHNLGKKERSCFPGVQAFVPRGFHGKRNDALADAVQIDDHLSGLFFFLFAFFPLLSRFPLVRLLGLVPSRIFLLFRCFLFVALRLDRRRIAFLQSRRINVS